MSGQALPSRELAERQSAWLAGARARLLRAAQIQNRKRVLEIGCGWGSVVDELRRRSGGSVTATDILRAPLAASRETSIADEQATSTSRLQARAEQLPFEDAAFDLVFAQYAMLWFADLDRAAEEMARVLTPGGAVAAIELDYGGLMELPPEVAVKDLWIESLQRAGADPLVGRKLPESFSRAGLRAEALLFDRVQPADEARFDLLAELPLEPEERAALDMARHRSAKLAGHQIAHLPFWLVLAEKTESTSSTFRMDRRDANNDIG